MKADRATITRATPADAQRQARLAESLQAQIADAEIDTLLPRGFCAAPERLARKRYCPRTEVCPVTARFRPEARQSGKEFGSSCLPVI